MNVIVAAAKHLEIEPFVSMQVPRYQDFRQNVDHREFRADLDHYMTQLMLDNSLRSRRDSVNIPAASKDKIRAYVNGLRKNIEEANSSDAKRAALLKKLDDFDTELEKKRTNTLAVARLTFELLAVPGGLWTSAEVTNKLIHNVMQTFAEAKSVEQEMQQLPETFALKVLSPPRQTAYIKTSSLSTAKAPR